MRSFSVVIIMLTFALVASAKREFVIKSGEMPKIFISPNEKVFVRTAIDILKQDIHSVFNDSLSETKNAGAANIIVGTLGVNPELEHIGIDLTPLTDIKQGFIIANSPKGVLVIAGSDSHGTTYGIMELSRLIGVSPWEWWADVIPEKKSSFSLPENFKSVQYPDVEYRGIFINDEDWGLMPWSGLNYEKRNGKGVIGAKTNEKIFELMLRLRANYYWPAMHECTQPFFLTDGNREAAEKYGIYIGGSHCEPMASSTAGEWPVRGKGEYDYVNNRQGVLEFWEDRMKNVAGQEIIYTLGMRGVHDSGMKGAKTVEEQRNVLETVFADQRDLIKKYVSDDVTSVPQVFIPYKEVLDVYNAGLPIHDDVTLMWCDDNYGYVRHFPTEEERNRKGGNGIYYHVSYWGRPHDYLWLGTFNPALLHQQMNLAYQQGIQRMWILNVGDIKPAEYQIELFMDMAWDIDKVNEQGVEQHLGNFLRREFGDSNGNDLVPVMKEHYRLAHIRKPEFMGNTRVEESDRKYYSTIRDLPWSESYINVRLNEYDKIANKVDSISNNIPSRLQDAFFQLVRYPVLAANQMNRKHLYGYLARHGKSDWQTSESALDSIRKLTEIYNSGIHNRGKWDGIMTYQPRKLPVFDSVTHKSEASTHIVEFNYLAKFNSNDAVKNEGSVIPLLGYDNTSTQLKKNESVRFIYDNNIDTDTIYFDVRMLPTHPLKGNKLRFILTFDGQASEAIDYSTKGRSEEWKQNVLRNQSVKCVAFPVKKTGQHSLILTALDDGVVFDCVYMIDKWNLKNNRQCEL